MFQKTKNIESAFRHLRVFTLLVVSASFGFCCFIALKSYELSERSAARIYLLADGKILAADVSARSENVAVEARDHVGSFHRYFFSLDPDEKVIEANVVRALYLADGSAKKQYDNLRESGFYASIISGNISQQITIDSVQVQDKAYPYYFRCVASQRIIRSTSIVTRRLLSEGYLRSVSRSDHNPHGFLIERWRILENRDIDVQSRTGNLFNHSSLK